MQCIAALDYEHLDDGKFLLTLAQSLSASEHFHPLIIHDNSANTERIMQQGVMRDEAETQDIKTLNHRLVNLFADEGIAALGVHGYQKKAITFKDNQLSIDAEFFDRLPSVSLFLSTLVWDEQAESDRHVELPLLAKALQEALGIETVYCFSLDEKTDKSTLEEMDEQQWGHLSENFSEKYIPYEFRNFRQPLRLTSAKSFGSEGRNSHSVLIRE